MTLKIEYVSVEKLIPYAKNSRTHSDDQVAQIAASVREFGFTNPVLIDGEDGIIAGHGRVLAARKLGMDSVPCIRLAHLTDTQRRAYVIADNKLALNAGWDDELLKLELGGLHGESFDMAVLGFSASELEAAMGLTAELDGAIDVGIDYKENFSVVVSCSDEADQQKTYERLSSMGLECRVLVN